MKMRMHLHLTEEVTLGAVDFIPETERGSPAFVAAQIRGGSILLKDGGAEIRMPLECLQLYLDPQTAFQLAAAMTASIPLDVPVVRTLELAS